MAEKDEYNDINDIASPIINSRFYEVASSE